MFPTFPQPTKNRQKRHIITKSLANSRSLDTPHITSHSCITVTSTGVVSQGARSGGYPNCWGVRTRCTHLTSGLFTRRSVSHCAAALAGPPRARPTIFGAKNPGFRSAIPITTDVPDTRHAPTHVRCHCWWWDIELSAQHSRPRVGACRSWLLIQSIPV